MMVRLHRGLVKGDDDLSTQLSAFLMLGVIVAVVAGFVALLRWMKR
jgi:hypothetical protein